MTTNIRVGDLVLVAKPTPCCGNTEHVGIIFTVSKLSRLNVRDCWYCSHRYVEPMAAIDENGDEYLISRLRRIPPIADLEKEEEFGHAYISG